MPAVLSKEIMTKFFLKNPKKKVSTKSNQPYFIDYYGLGHSYHTISYKIKSYQGIDRPITKKKNQ